MPVTTLAEAWNTTQTNQEPQTPLQPRAELETRIESKQHSSKPLDDTFIAPEEVEDLQTIADQTEKGMDPLEVETEMTEQDSKISSPSHSMETSDRWDPYPKYLMETEPKPTPSSPSTSGISS